MKRQFIRRETWGYSIWRGAEQVGAGVGLDPLAFRGLTLDKVAARVWRKRGVILL